MKLAFKRKKGKNHTDNIPAAWTHPGSLHRVNKLSIIAYRIYKLRALMKLW